MNDNYSYVICGIYMADVPMITTLQIYHLVSMLIYGIEMGLKYDGHN